MGKKESKSLLVSKLSSISNCFFLLPIAIAMKETVADIKKLHYRRSDLVANENCIVKSRWRRKCVLRKATKAKIEILRYQISDLISIENRS